LQLLVVTFSTTISTGMDHFGTRTHFTNAFFLYLFPSLLPSWTGNVDDDEMAVMLKVGKVKDNLTSMEARFWCNNPHIMLTLMQFCMWQNGQTLAGLLFYGAYFNGTCWWYVLVVFFLCVTYWSKHQQTWIKLGNIVLINEYFFCFLSFLSLTGMEGSCYYVNRGIVPMVLSALVCIITLLHAAFVTVPTFSMVTHMASHKKKKFDPHGRWWLMCWCVLFWF